MILALTGLVSTAHAGFEPCDADLNGDGIVNGGDLGLLLGNFGTGGVGDLNVDGDVDGADLGLLLGNFGIDCDGDVCPGVGGCCSPHKPPGCNDAACCETVCGIFPLCCKNTWDLDCAKLAMQMCSCEPPPPGCGGAAGECCEANGTPGCDDASCCNDVCSFDPFCCQVEWDQSCAIQAIESCGCVPPEPECGDAFGNCCLAHPTTGCDDPECCDAICTFDPTCCEIEWDQFCADAAGLKQFEEECDCKDFVVCDEATGNCCIINGTQGCNDPNCCEVVCEIDPFCCENQWDGNCVSAAEEMCGFCNDEQKCGGPQSGDCCIANGTPACNDADCCETVCALDEVCCDQDWDSFCVMLATDNCPTLCPSPPQNPECPGGGSCFEPNFTPGCDVSSCCNMICAFDPFCCESGWDAACASAAALTCIECGNDNAGDCCLANGTPYCENEECCDLVCAQDSFCCVIAWDQACVSIALNECDLNDIDCPDCGVPGAGPCDSANGTPACDNFACCQTVCVQDGYCCEIAWDQFCAEEAISLCGCDGMSPNSGECTVPNGSPGCNNAECCDTVCDTMPICCDTAWDQQCAELAVDMCEFCGDATTGNCFEANGSPYCDDQNCCTTVCNIDQFCCNTQWDDLCAVTAMDECTDPDMANCGSADARQCLSPNITPGCGNFECCQTICEFDSFCCEVRWDAICVSEAQFFCDIDFPECPGNGMCEQPNGSPGCNNEACCNTVCEISPFCCDNTWDQQCADLAEAACSDAPACPGEGDCSMPNGTPGCEDATCCEVVCRNNPFCCDVEWDSGCVSVADTLCSGQTNCPCVGSCFEAKDSPGCDDEACCNAVCAFGDPFCCDEMGEWDFICASLATELCCPEPGCGSFCAGDCFAQHDGPYCSDFECCQAVCEIDNFCCQIVWDFQCVEAAMDRCIGCGSEEAGSCYVDNGTPGCEDIECCQAVCEMDPECCDLIWDQMCVDLAVGDKDKMNGLCPPEPECGDDTTGSCCEANGTPYCDDESCCEMVCMEDDFCCDFKWDSLCANMAREMCSECPMFPMCGDVCAGDCCAANDTPFCNDQQCCDLVCDQDSFCCDQIGGSWDETCAQLACQICDRGSMAICNTCGDEGSGDCCFTSQTPGCNDEACCNLVCESDSFCCCVEWDSVCVQAAVENCSNDMGDPLCPPPMCGEFDAGSCMSPNPTPACEDEECCDDVCAQDDFCCDEAWDQQCVDLAFELCFTKDICSMATGDCFKPNGTPGCDEASCCETVCKIESFCCTKKWDNFCVFLAQKNCN